MQYFAPFLISFVIAVILAPLIIPALKRLKASQTERDIMESHVKKTGTPTMGGIIILIAFAAGTLICGLKEPKNLPVLLLALGYGVIGFLDDYLKVVKKRSDGLFPWQKMLLQIILTTAFAIYMVIFSGVSMKLLVPFTHYEINIGWLAIPVLYLAVIGTANGTNFTDGLDGLATTVTIITAGFFAVASIRLGGGIEVAALSMMGALLGFLQFNCYPAKVFMGDTGSLALGGFVAAAAYMMRMPLFIILIGIIYLVEVISVILQVGYFKLTHGRRIFRMAPIHHHFELGGWSETKVVCVFATVTLLMCGLCLATLG